MTNHTPGPWHVYDSRFREVNGAIMDAAGNKVASVYGPTTEELDANARLIAAAPKLLEALKAASAADNHSVDCAYRNSFGRVLRLDGRCSEKTRNSVWEECERGANPCDCYLRVVNAAISKVIGGN